MNIGLCSLYCLYVLASGATFSLGWFLFWLFFGFIIAVSILAILFPIALIICLFSNVSFSVYFGNVVSESKEKLFNWCNKIHF